ncbi:GIVxVP protein [Vulcanococcus limneticus]|uniref:GIVxVP protein n=1 Tax=Vulcanococcus limneticus TaxID=2170428 RepID=UPI00398BE354
MGLNRTAKGIVLVPSLLLGGAFLAAAAWGEAGSNRPLAIGLGAALMGAGLLAQLLPEQASENPEFDEGR